MQTRIQKWGNSQAVRLPKVLLEELQLHENDEVELKIENGNLIIIPLKKHKTLQERIAEYQGDYIAEEWDVGESEGNEVLR
ncbi:MAG: AbrB/MazE/SpoVT family DNA-binding domain-containing protein [Eubacteriales bacterium]|nr:AbrB/MazE/SpoVT family DNA-binding domain-containing protein [Eubacteriales bacterium]